MRVVYIEDLIDIHSNLQAKIFTVMKIRCNGHIDKRYEIWKL